MRTKRLKRDTSGLAYINVRVTEQVLEEIKRIAWTEGYTDVSDYVRDLMRKDLKARGVSIKTEKKPEKEA